MDLLDLLRESEQATDPRQQWHHVVLPSMGYVCGGTILGLDDGGPRGTYTLGGWGQDDVWATVTCPGCRALGQRETARIAHRQQKPLNHVCEPGDPDCYWQTLPDNPTTPPPSL